MIDFSLMAGGRCSGETWRVGILGFSLGSGKPFLLDKTEIAELKGKYPFEDLFEYSKENNFFFSFVDVESSKNPSGFFDAVFFIGFRGFREGNVSISDVLSRYILLSHPDHRASLRDKSYFSVVFSPAGVNHESYNHCYVNSNVGFGDNDPLRNVEDPSREHAALYVKSADFWICSVSSAVARDATIKRCDRPKLSVVIPAFNYAEFLKQAIESVLSQNISNLEIIVLDNCSSDHTPQVVSEYLNDPRFRYIRHRVNVGIRHNWMNGLRIARGKYLNILSADDFLNPGYLERVINALDDNPEVSVAYSSIRWVDKNAQPIEQKEHPGYAQEDYVGGRNELANLLVHDNYLTPSAVIYRLDEFLATWRPIATNGGGDWNMAVQMAEKFPDFIYLKDPGASYRWHGAQQSSSFYTSISPLLDHLSIIEGVFCRGSQCLIKGYEIAIAEHVERRLGLYPQEVNSEHGLRAKSIIRRLKSLVVENDRPFFTVVITTYNRPELLRDALNSLEKQVFKDFEVCLVNDAGEPVEHLLTDSSFPIYYFRQGKNQGLSAARNAALKMARGCYITYLDDDDFYLENHLQSLAAVFKERPDVVAYTGVEYVNEKIENGQRIEQSRTALFAHESYDRDRLFVQNYIPVNTWAHSRECLPQVGEFDTTLTAFEDWDMLLRLAQHYEFVHIPEVSAEVRVRTNGGNSDHMLQRERKSFSALYNKIYRRYPVLDNDDLAARREQRLAELLQAEQAPSIEPFSISKWLSERRFNKAQSVSLAQNLAHVPKIHIAIVDLAGDEHKVRATLSSLDGSQSFVSATVFGSDLTADVVAITPETLLDKLVAHFNDVTESWFLVVEAGDEFTKVGLTVVALELARAGQCRAIYADVMMRNGDAEPGLIMRTDMNLDLLLSFPSSMSKHWLFNAQVWRDMGGFDRDLDQTFELDYILRLVKHQGFAGLGHVSEPLLVTEPLMLSDSPQEREVILRHLTARGYVDATIGSRRPGRYDVNYAHSDQPMVSIVVCVHANIAWALRCLESLLEKTSYPHYEVLLLDQGQGDEAISGWLQGVKQMSVPKLRVLDIDSKNYARQCNQALTHCRGDVLLFLDSSAGVIEVDWLDQLLNHVQRFEVGAVGAKLLTGQGKIAHAGWFLGVNGVATPAFVGESNDASGYLQRLQVDQNYTAVSGKCLMVRKALFAELGGFDEDLAIDNWLDIDFCLRLQQSGYLNVWTPRVQLVVSDETLPSADPEAMYERWLPLLARDPAYNLNASLIGTPYSLAPNDLTWRPGLLLNVPTVLAHMGDRQGCGHYRVIQPFRALKQAGLIDGGLAGQLLDVVNLERYSPDSIVMQRLTTDAQHQAMRKMQKFSKSFKVYELDDYLPNLPVKNAHRESMPKGVLKAIRTSLSYVDRFVVSTPALAEAFKGMHNDIQIVQNSLDPKWWRGLSSARRTSKKPRVGWAGGISHAGDLALISDVVKALANEVNWVFFGMCPADIQPYVHEFYPGVEIEQYPSKLASLNLDLAIAPVEQNLFNECKSNLRVLEYGVLGIPVIASDINCYRDDDLPITLVRNRFKDWLGAIRMHIADLDASALEGDRLQSEIDKNWMLEGVRLERWYKTWLPH